MSTLPAVGSHVRVQWGFDTVEGDVVDAYDSGFGKRSGLTFAPEGGSERMRMGRSIACRGSAGLGTQRTSLDSVLGVGCPRRKRAVSTMENSWRTSPSDV
jgi:hypothetical protein